MAKRKAMPDFSKEKPKELDRDQFYGMRLDDEQYAFASAIWNPDIDIVFCNAKAGTGKSSIAVGVANMLVLFGDYKELIYIISPYGERKQGWLPGTITEKSSVYFEPLYQALENCNVNTNQCINNEGIANQKTGTGYITCITDTFLRGSNLKDAIVILDEAQNFTVPQLKKTLTRVGANTKVIVIGHDLQCDLDNPEQSGFITYMKHFAGKDRTAICKLTTNYRGWISQWADELKE